MIFFFTGTGNSQAAAESLRQPGERMISIGEAVKSRQYDYEMPEGEALGFVCPVYFSGLPLAVEWFIGKLQLAGEPSFVYVVFTCGAFPGGADGEAERLLKEKGIRLNRTYALRMPENYFPVFPIPSEKRQEKILAAAERRLEKIRADIEGGLRGEAKPGIAYRSAPAVRAASAAAHRAYRAGGVRRTSKFWVDDACVGCGACERRCPCGAIRMTDGRPAWVKDTCVMCLGCTRCGAIHYAGADEKHGRYKHPIFRKKENHSQAASGSCCQEEE